MPSLPAWCSPAPVCHQGPSATRARWVHLLAGAHPGWAFQGVPGHSANPAAHEPPKDRGHRRGVARSCPQPCLQPHPNSRFVEKKHSSHRPVAAKMNPTPVERQPPSIGFWPPFFRSPL